MKQQKRRLGIILVILLLLIAAISACAPSVPIQAPVAQKPATFQVGLISLAPAVAMVGDTVTVSTVVTNTGDLAGSYTAALMVNGRQVDSKDVQVAPGSNQGIAFQLTENASGTYNLAVGSSTATLTVYNWVPYTLQYDHSDGAVEGGYVNGDQGHLVMFTPPNQTFRVNRIRILAAARISNTYELNNLVTFRIWNKDASTMLWSQDVPWGNFLSGSWQEVAVPNVRVDGDFRVEVVTHSYAAGHPIDFASMLGFVPIIPHGHIFFRITGPLMGTVQDAVLVGFDYPASYVDAPLNRPPTPSGYSYQGKPVDPGQKRLEGINWLIRVDGEGAPGS